SEARAAARQDRYPELGPVSDWDWRRIESLAYGLTRRLGTMGATGPVGQPRAAEVPAADAASPVRSPKAQNSGKAESPGSPKNSADPKSPWDDAVRRRRS
ncbi:MAG: hypothetical protein ACREVL_08725, partial [Solimonas sp.]